MDRMAWRDSSGPGPGPGKDMTELTGPGWDIPLSLVIVCGNNA